MKRFIPAILMSFLIGGCGCEPPKTNKSTGVLKVVEASLDFGLACPKPTDPALKVEVRTNSLHVRNEGTATLEINRFEIETSKADQFSIDKSAIPTSIEPSGEVVVPITFTPKSDGTVIADLTIAGDEADKPATVVKLLGEGKKAPANPNLSMSCPGGRFAGDSCAAATCSKDSDCGAPDTCDQTVKLCHKPSNPNIFFPDTAKNGTAEMTLILKNTGCPAMQVHSIAVTTDTSGGEDANTFTLADGQETSFGIVGGADTTANIKVRFSPKDSNSFRGKLTFQTNDSVLKTVSVDLRGAGIEPAIDLACVGCNSPTLCDFKPKLGFCSGKFTIHNSGQQELVINDVRIQGNNPMFTVGTRPLKGTKIAGNSEATAAIEVLYAPGLKFASDFLVVDSSAGSATAELRGGSPPVLAADPDAFLDFGSKLATTTDKTLPVKISNIATYNKQLPLTITAIEVEKSAVSNAANTFDIPAATAIAPSTKVLPGADVTTQVHFKSAPNGGSFVANLLLKTDDPAYSGIYPPYLITLGASTTCNPAPVSEITSPTTTTCTTSCSGQNKCVNGFCNATGSVSISLNAQKTVTLSGESSYDLKEDTTGNCTLQDPAGVEKFEWTLTSKPSGSSAAITPTGIGTTSKTTLTADKQGTYLVKLFVYDKTGLKSTATTYTVTAGQ